MVNNSSKIGISVAPVVGNNSEVGSCTQTNALQCRSFVENIIYDSAVMSTRLRDGWIPAAILMLFSDQRFVPSFGKELHRQEKRYDRQLPKT